MAHEQKDALIHALWAHVQALRAQVEGLASGATRLRSRVAALEAKLGQSPETPDNASLPPSQGKTPSRGAGAVAAVMQGHRPAMPRRCRPASRTRSPAAQAS